MIMPYCNYNAERKRVEETGCSDHLKVYPLDTSPEALSQIRSSVRARHGLFVTEEERENIRKMKMRDKNESLIEKLKRYFRS